MSNVLARSVFVAAVIFGATSTARAQLLRGPDRPPDPSTAFGLSLGGVGLGVGAIALGIELDSDLLFLAGLVGVVVLPSAGQIYAGADRRAAAGLIIRGGGATLLVAGALIALTCTFPLNWDPEDDDRCGAARPLALGGLIVGGGGVVYSLIDAPIAAAQAKRRLTLVPAPIVGPDRTTGAGLMLGGSF